MILRHLCLLLCTFVLVDWLSLTSLTFVTVSAAPTGLELYRSWTHAIPANLFARMEADCRTVHGWEEKNVPTLKDGKRVTRWFPLNTFPRTALEEAILHLVKLAQPDPTRLIGFEWWIQKINENGPLNFHVDKDEGVATIDQYLLHPLWSSVFYITKEGGGTLITNQLSPYGNGYSPEEPEEGAWSFPEENKFLRFNGTLLHGVIPHKQLGKFPKERITFLVNFWHVRPKEPNCQLLPHEKVTGLRLLSKEDILALRAENEANPSQPPTPQPMINIDLRPGSDQDQYTFRMDLPGNQHQTIRLPRLSPEGGETYYLHYKTSKKIFKLAVKTSKSMRQKAKKIKQKWLKGVQRREEAKKKKEQETHEGTTTDSTIKKDKKQKKKSKNSDDEDEEDEDEELVETKSSKPKKKKDKKSDSDSTKKPIEQAGTFSQRYKEALETKEAIKAKNKRN